MDHVNALKQLFENRLSMSETRFVGRTCLGKIENDLMGKIEFSSFPQADFYAYLTISVLERTSGIVDQITFALSDVIGIKQVNGTGTIPGLISQGEQLAWDFDITEADCHELAETVNRYFEMFQCMTAEQTPAHCAGALPDHIID